MPWLLSVHIVFLLIWCAALFYLPGLIAGSDARLLRGLLAVLLARVEGLTAEGLQAVDLADWFAHLGLSRQLSPSRSNGLNAVLQRMRELAGQDRAC